jgi:hypothetical protein
MCLSTGSERLSGFGENAQNQVDEALSCEVGGIIAESFFATNPFRMASHVTGQVRAVTTQLFPDGNPRRSSNQLIQNEFQAVNNGAISRCSSSDCITVSLGRSAIRLAASSTLGMMLTSPAVQMNTPGRASAQ